MVLAVLGGQLHTWIDRYGYEAVFALVGLESIGVPLPGETALITAALYARFRSRAQHTFADKMLSAMRKGFGGHVEPGAKAP